nr:hypothetical protein [Amycolatopsis sp. FDAARGOS 1241]
MTVRVILARPMRGTVGETCRVVHVFPVSSEEASPSRLSACCGADFGPAELEVVAPLSGMPCVTCLRYLPTDTELQAGE